MCLSAIPKTRWRRQRSGCERLGCPSPCIIAMLRSGLASVSAAVGASGNHAATASVRVLLSLNLKPQPESPERQGGKDRPDNERNPTEQQDKHNSTTPARNWVILGFNPNPNHRFFLFIHLYRPWQVPYLALLVSSSRFLWHLVTLGPCPPQPLQQEFVLASYQQGNSWHTS